MVFLAILVVACRSPGATPETSARPAPTSTATPEIGVTLATRLAPTRAVVRTSPTPLPTATATPTATPVVYVVEEGDTLLGIAIQNYTTVDEIESLNPGIVPELLQIGQRLVLPPPATPVYDGSLPTPIPLQIEVRRVQLARTSLGSLWLLGEVVNHGEYPAASIRVQIDLVGPDGKNVTGVSTWVVPALVRAGESGAFAALVPQEPAFDVQPVVSVIAGETLRTSGTYYLDLSTDISEVTMEDGQVTIAGMIENSGGEEATAVHLVATLYNAQGEVTGYARQIMEEPLQPGEERSFTLDAVPPGGPAVDYTLTAYALVQRK